MSSLHPPDSDTGPRDLRWYAGRSGARLTLAEALTLLPADHQVRSEDDETQLYLFGHRSALPASSFLAAIANEKTRASYGAMRAHVWLGDGGLRGGFVLMNVGPGWCMGAGRLQFYPAGEPPTAIMDFRRP